MTKTDAETIASWLDWHKFSDDPEIWATSEWDDEDECPDDDNTLSGPLDFRSNLDDREYIKAHLCNLNASIKLIHRMNRWQAWRLVVDVSGVPGFDQQARSEGYLWYKAALYFARLEND